MVKSLSSALLISFVAVMVADAGRVSIDATLEAGGMTKCVAEGVSGGATGMFITWGSAAAIKECGPTRPNTGEGLTYEFKFTEAFSVSFDRKCDCSINGETIVSFKPLTLRQANVCMGTEEGRDALAFKRNCWDAYLRGRGTSIRSFGGINVPEYTLPWMSGNFRVSREGACDDDDCNSIALPGVLDGMSREHKRIIGDGIKKIMDGEGDKVPEVLRQMIDILPASALDDAEFQQIDEDGDGTLSLDELADFYPQFDRPVLEKFMKEVDENGNGSVDPDEFSALKEKMREYDPTVDLIDGKVDFLKDDDANEVKEMKPEWKVETVVCMKGGVKVDPRECGDVKRDEAIREFNTNC